MPVVAERVTINPTVEDPTLRPLDLVGLDRAWGIYLLEHDYPPPDLDVLRSSSSDTEGDPVVSSRYLNRTITAKVRVFEPEDAAATNLVPNPNFETNLTGWELSSGSFTEPTRTQVASPEALLAPGSDYSMRLRAVKDNTATERFATAQTLTGLAGIPVVAGTTYTQSWYLYVADAPDRGGLANFNLEINWYNAAGELLSTSSAAGVVVNAGETRRMTQSAAAPALAAFCRLRLTGKTTTALDVVDFYVDRVQLTATAAATPYFDGDTPGCDWSGTRHESASTRPAPDGTRFSRICRDITRILDGIKTRRSGVLRRVSALGGPLYYDLRTAKLTDAPQNIGIGMKRAEYGLAFEALPGGRGQRVQIGSWEELTKPSLTFLAENIPGELPALGELLLEDKQGQNQLAAWIGWQRDTYSSAATAELFYEAEGRTRLGATIEEADATASGGKAVVNKKLVNAWQAVMSTQASGGGAHLSHVGTYRVLARIRRPPVNAGEVSVKLAWTQGDFVNVEENEPVTFGVDEQETDWTVEDLGIITIDQAPAGSTQRWEGRVVAKSTSTNDWVYVDCLYLIPATEGAGEARATTKVPTPSALLAYDSYDQTAGAVTGKSAGLGGVYVVHEGSDTDDFQVNATEHLLTRTAVSDTGELLGAGVSGRAVGLPVNLATVAMSYAYRTSNFNTNVQAFQFLRYKDKSNYVWVRCGTLESGTSMWVDFGIKVAGVETFATGTKYLGGANRSQWNTLTAMLVGENYLVYLGQTGYEPTLLLSGVTSKLAALGAGGTYIGDRCGNATATTRYWDQLQVWEPTLDAVVYANRGFELRADQARRQDSGGTTWGKPAYKGDYLLVPQAGPEKKPTRFTVLTSRNPDADSGIDDKKASLWVTPRYLLAPPT